MTDSNRVIDRVLLAVPEGQAKCDVRKVDTITMMIFRETDADPGTVDAEDVWFCLRELGHEGDHADGRITRGSIHYRFWRPEATDRAAAAALDEALGG